MAPDADVDVEAPLLVDQGYDLDCRSQNDEEELVRSGYDGDDRGVESLDYDASQNVVHDTLVKKRHSSRRIYGLSVQPGMHALAGATAMLGGVFRSSISLVVVMVECTGGIKFLLPVILAIVTSNWVAYHIHSTGAYESDLERIGEVHFLRSEPSQKLHFIAAQDIMAPDVICFREITSVAEVVEVLRETCHNGFLVVRHTNIDDHNPTHQYR